VDPGHPHFLWLGPVADQVAFVGRHHANSLPVDGPELTVIRRAARSHGITVALGCSEKSYDSLHISQTVIDSDGSVLLHRRMLKPTHVEHVQPLSKYALYAQGEELHIASWPCFGLYLDFAHQLSAEANSAATEVYAVEGAPSSSWRPR
jgi:aliphatic nitrilase